MPKRFSPSDKKKWLELYDSGKTEKWIARNEARCDVRTVKKGIDEACRGRDAQLARAELLKDALRSHQGSLLAVVNSLLSALLMPAHDLILPEKNEGSPLPIPLSAATARYEIDRGWTVILDAENTALWELLREHLRRDPMWNALTKWKKALGAHIEARAILKQRTLTLLEEKTQLRVDLAAPALVDPRAVELFYRQALNRALGIQGGTNPEDNIRALPAGKVMYTDLLLAQTSVGEEEKCRQNMLDASKQLQVSPEAMRVSRTYSEADQLTSKVKRTVEEISLLGLVPGHCRVCRRLGM